MDVHKKLSDAMLAQDIDEVSKILSSNDEIDINHLDQKGFSFLHKAVSLKPPNVEILELLLAQEKIDVNIKSSDFTDRTPLYLACMDSVIPREIVELLIVKDKTTVNVLTEFKSSPLHSTCWNNRLDLTKLLLENGADVEVTAGVGFTCLFVCHYETIDYLLDHTSINAKVKNDAGHTALDYFLDDKNDPENPEKLLETIDKLVQRTFDRDPITNAYKFDEFFITTLKACKWATTEELVSKYFIKKFYSENNSKYHLIERLEKYSFDDIPDSDERFYLYALVHDDVKNPSFHSKFEYDIDYQWIFEYSSLQLPFILISLKSDDLNELILEFFEYLHSIGLHRNDINFDSFNTMIFIQSLRIIQENLSDFHSYKRFYKILKFFHKKGNTGIFRYYLANAVFLECTKMTHAVMPFAHNIDTILRGLRNSQTHYQMIVNTYGDFGMGANEIFSLKQICRSKIRKTLNQKYPDCATFFEKMNSLTSELPRSLVKYVRFDEIYGED